MLSFTSHSFFLPDYAQSEAEDACTSRGIVVAIICAGALDASGLKKDSKLVDSTVDFSLSFLLDSFL